MFTRARARPLLFMSKTWILASCLTRCYGPCNRLMCWQCKSKEGSLKSACGNCKTVIENNSDFDIGPQDRDECYLLVLFTMDVASPCFVDAMHRATILLRKSQRRRRIWKKNTMLRGLSDRLFEGRDSMKTCCSH